MARTAKHLLDELTRRGPHQVLRGDLALVGLPGVVFTPAAGLGLPAIAFGHGWLQPTSRYRGLFRHLASWGVVVAAPGTHVGPLGSARLLAADLRTALDVCVGVRLGEGAISVDQDRLGLAGHSTGAGAAVLAAADDSRVKAVATLAPAQTKPFATDAARQCQMPSLHVVGGNDLVAPPRSHGELIAQSWGGPTQLRVLPKASHLGFAEGRHWSGLLVHGKAEHATHRISRALLTAFFLVHLTGEKKYLPLLEESTKTAPVTYETVPTLAG
ncbi:dienelactone hydrolase family protein [Actinokineospora globicatena]|uniref:dienelactone hydrolase family protein n=1 Tax=Actinokineospora globicatena TaxID=103729 RepID=UPI0020A3131B|nr:alpha/beta hydrolase [Actinokineospora globicatena]MCP2301889.1 Dienelactone hydrolase [Actinokineospora globicatena]GLW76452.1 dienelactone hydrolase [Actinokineospora globicatena]GLW83287.1 dienelactone hydrolase [Actinokineospora globicatena]